ncbi:MAG: hypothetical protein ACOYMV_11260, partial [Verrucomicrobiia bacterium]
MSYPRGGTASRWGRGFCAVALGVAASSSNAQDFDRLKPKEPESKPGRVEEPSEKPVSMASGAQKPLVGALRGIVFLRDPTEVRKTGVPVFDGLRSEGVWLLDMESYQILARAHLGKPVSRASLNAMVREIIQHYRKWDRPVVDVVVPEQ